MVGSEVNSSKVKRRDVFMENLLRAVDVHVKENKEVCEGEAKVQAQSTAQEPPVPQGEIAAPIEPAAPKKKRVKQAAKRPSNRGLRTLAATKPSKSGLRMIDDSTDDEADQLDDISKRPRKDKPTQGLPLSQGPIAMDFTHSSSPPLEGDRQSPPQEGDRPKAAASHNLAAQSSTPQDQSSSHTPFIKYQCTEYRAPCDLVYSPEGTIELIGGSPSENVDAEIGIDKPPPKRPSRMDSTSHVSPVHSKSTMPKDKTSSPRKSKIPPPPKDNSPPPKEPPPPPKKSTASQLSTHIPTLPHTFPQSSPPPMAQPNKAHTSTLPHSSADMKQVLATLRAMHHQIIASQLQMCEVVTSQHALETKVSTVCSLLNDVMKGQDTLKADLQEVKDRASEVVAQGERSAAAMTQVMSRAEIIESRIEGTEVHLAGVETLMHTIAENVDGLQKKKKFKVIVQSSSSESAS